MMREQFGLICMIRCRCPSLSRLLSEIGFIWGLAIVLWMDGWSPPSSLTSLSFFAQSFIIHWSLTSLTLNCCSVPIDSVHVWEWGGSVVKRPHSLSSLTQTIIGFVRCLLATWRFYWLVLEIGSFLVRKRCSLSCLLISHALAFWAPLLRGEREDKIRQEPSLTIMVHVVLSLIWCPNKIKWRWMNEMPINTLLPSSKLAWFDLREEKSRTTEKRCPPPCTQKHLLNISIYLGLNECWYSN